MSVTCSAVGDRVKIEVDSTPATGPAQKWSMTAAYDGKEHAVT